MVGRVGLSFSFLVKRDLSVKRSCDSCTCLLGWCSVNSILAACSGDFSRLLSGRND